MGFSGLISPSISSSRTAEELAALINTNRGFGVNAGKRPLSWYQSKSSGEKDLNDVPFLPAAFQDCLGSSMKDRKPQVARSSGINHKTVVERGIDLDALIFLLCTNGCCDGSIVGTVDTRVVEAKTKTGGYSLTRSILGF